MKRQLPFVGCGLALLAATSCAAAPSTGAPAPLPRDAAPPAPGAGRVEPAASSPPSAEASPARAERPREVTVEVPLPSKALCRLVFRAPEPTQGTESEVAGGTFLVGIERIASEGAGCEGGVLFDLSAERAARPTGEGEPPSLQGGTLLFGHVADLSRGPPGIQIADMSFDGFLDLCVSAGIGTVYSGGAVEQPRRCWLYQRASRSFVENGGLASLQWPIFHAASRTIEAGVMLRDTRYAFGRTWVGPQRFRHGRYRWKDDELETLELTFFRLDEDPDGRPIPVGAHWEQRHRSMGGALTKVFEGTVTR